MEKEKMFRNGAPQDVGEYSDPHAGYLPLSNPAKPLFMASPSSPFGSGGASE